MRPSEPLHVGLSLGRVEHWHDGLGEFSRQLALALAREAPRLRDELGWQLWLHLPQRWHGLFGDAFGYLPTHTTQRVVHLTRPRFALWHRLHQHIRLRAPWRSARLVETVHDLNFLRVKGAAKAERYRRRLQRRLARCDAAIAITQYVADDIAREAPDLRTPLHVIHNGATDLTAAPREAVEGIGEEPFLLHVSRMAPSKNIAALLALAAAWPEQALVLAGAPSPYASQVQQQVRERGLANVTIRLDVSEAQKAWLYARCAGFLFPSLTEGFGLPPLEAMHFGKPTFLSRLTSLPEIGSDAAYYFDDGFEPGAMRALVEAGLRDAPARAEAVAAHARGFSWRRCAEQHIALYREALARTR